MPLPIHRDEAISNALRFLSKILLRHPATRLNPRNGITIRTVSVARKLKIFLRQDKENLLTIAQGPVLRHRNRLTYGSAPPPWWGITKRTSPCPVFARDFLNQAQAAS